jgi:hypothetical protein
MRERRRAECVGPVPLLYQSDLQALERAAPRKILNLLKECAQLPAAYLPPFHHPHILEERLQIFFVLHLVFEDL